MNQGQNNKEWQMSQPNTSMPESPITSQAPPNYSPTPTMNHAYSYPTQNTMMHPPLHSYPPPIASDAYIPSAMKAESDPRLPGVMVLSQPSTPRPTSIINEESNAMDQKNRNSYVSSYSSISPYPLMPRKRSRNDNSLFPTETGPSFSAAKPLDNLFSPDRTNLLTVRVQSKMDRGFFLADNDWTCYRRNYFQVSSTFSIHGINRYYGEHELQCFVQTAHHGLQPVNRFLLGISARVSNSDKQIELVQHTPKRDKGPQTKPLPKPITPNGNLSLSSVGTNQNIATFERIQFKTATANNGKRRAAQQYYIVAVELFAETHEGERVCVASCISSPLVVRGRSPGHYADNNQDRTSSNTNPSLMAAVANASAAMPTANNHPSNSNPNGNNNNNNDDDERYPYSRQPSMPGHPLMSNPSQEYSSPYTSYYNGYPPPPPYGMMIPPPPPPSSSSSNNNNNNNNNNTANNNNSNNSNHNNSNHNNNHTSSPPSHHLPHPHSHQANAPPPPNPPYMVHSMSADPSSSESSSPDMYQGASEYTIQHSDKHISQLNIHPISMDSNGAHTNEWSRSRYHSAGSVPSPHNDHPHSYFSQQHHHHHHQQQDGAPPTPTTPFSKKYDTIPSTTEQHTN